MTELIKLKDCTITEIEYECRVHGGCPTCGCGGDTIADMTFYVDDVEMDYLSITNTKKDCLAISSLVFQEVDCMRILGCTNVDFKEMTLFEFAEWFCGCLKPYIKTGDILAEFEGGIDNVHVFIYKDNLVPYSEQRW